MGFNSTRPRLQSEATGAVMEVTKIWLKPSGKERHELVTARVCRPQRVNAEQASKMPMRRSTRVAFRGRLTRLWELSKYEHSRCAGVLAAACTQGKRAQHGKPLDVVGDDQPDAGDG